MHLVGGAVAQLRAYGALGTLICPSAPWAPWWHLLRSGTGWAADVVDMVPLGTAEEAFVRLLVPRAFVSQRHDCHSAGPLGLRLEEARRREALRAHIIARRAGTPRRLERLDATAVRLIALAMDLRSRASGGAAVPAAAARLAAGDKAPRTWNRYATAGMGNIRVGAELYVPASRPSPFRQLPRGVGGGVARLRPDQAVGGRH